MQQPPYNPYNQSPSQPNTYYPPQQPPYIQSGTYQQPPYPQPGQYQPYGQPSGTGWQPPQQPPKKSRKGTWIALAIVLALIFFCCTAMYGIANSANKNSASSSTSTSAQIQTTSAPATPTQPPTPTPTQPPTPTPIPTLSSAQVENAYKATTMTTSVDNLDKDGNQDQGKDVHFTCKILNFVKDGNGNTAGANVDDPDSYSISVVQVVFPSSTDLSQLNQGDILEVWGTDEGVFSGQNAFGATVQEVGVATQYMTDTTTNYQTP